MVRTNAQAMTAIGITERSNDMAASPARFAQSRRFVQCTKYPVIYTGGLIPILTLSNPRSPNRGARRT